MASIKISDIYPAGLDLFADSECFMTELTENELNINYGGISPTFIGAGIAIAAFGGGYALGRYL